MTEKKISVIVPAYNVEKYIRRCLDSLVNQTYPNLEVIVVNDGSTDRTGDIIEEFAERFPGKVFPYFQQNQGQAKARNFGMTKATGEYIGFVDSDDFARADMYELLYREAEEKGCDLVTCGYFGCNDVTGVVKSYQTGYQGEFDQSIYENPQILKVNSPYPWNKLFTRELLERSGFQFPSGLIFEDLCAIFPLFLDAKKVGRVHDRLYYYIKDRKGSTVSTFNEKHGQIIDALQIMNEAYRRRGEFERFYPILLFFNIRHIYARFEEMKTSGNVMFKNEFTERAHSLLDGTFPGWRESKQFTEVQELLAGKQSEEEDGKNLDEEFDKEKWLTGGKKKKAPRRAEVFDAFVSSKKLEKNRVLIECYRGNDFCGSGYYLKRLLDSCGTYEVYIAAADGGKLEKIRAQLERRGETAGVTLLDMTDERYLEILATASYVVTNRSFAGFYRKRKGQKFIFTDFMPSLAAQGVEVPYETKNMQSIQFSLAQADAILFPAEWEEQFVPLLRCYHMDEVCCDKGVFVSVSDFFREWLPTAGCPAAWESESARESAVSASESVVRIAYAPSVKKFPGLKDSKCYLFLSDLRKKLTELDERIGDGRKILVCFPRLVRRRFKENLWKHIEFLPDGAEATEVLAGCQGLIGEYGEELYLMKALGKPVCRFVTNEADVAWSQGLHEDGVLSVPTFSDMDEVVTWVNGIGVTEEDVLDEEGIPEEKGIFDSFHPQTLCSQCKELFSPYGRKKNKKQRRNIAYLPGMKNKKGLEAFLQKYSLERTLFFIEKDKLDEHMAAWLRQWEPDIRYIVIIRSLVLSAREIREIKYKLTTKDKIKEKRDRERYGL